MEFGGKMDDAFKTFFEIVVDHKRTPQRNSYDKVYYDLELYCGE